MAANDAAQLHSRPRLLHLKDFPANASFSLTCEEASYSKERVLARWPNTMLAYLLTPRRHPESVPFPWTIPFALDLPEPISEKIFHARNFSEAINRRCNSLQSYAR